ncbi:MAG: GNAT family N-acetyltransferase [Bacteroidia bacterium]
MEVKHKLTGDRGSFYIEENDKRIGTMTYTFDKAGIIIVEHTKVHKEFEGRGIGRRLVSAVVKYARENNYKIIPHCPYTKKVLESSNEYNDILYK